MNLSNKSANQPIKNLLHESHSKLRIANPMLDQQALNLSMVGRKMVPVHRLKNAIINKETEGKFKVNSHWPTFFVVNTFAISQGYDQLQILLCIWGKKYSNKPCIRKGKLFQATG